MKSDKDLPLTTQVHRAPIFIRFANENTAHSINLNKT